jgi:hypothetical protein
VQEEEEGQEERRRLEGLQEEKEEVMRRPIRGAALVLALLLAVTIAEPGGAIPKRTVTLAKGHLRGPWRIAAYQRADGTHCETLIRHPLTSALCTNVPLIPDPVFSPAIWNQHDPGPLMIAVIAASDEVAEVRLKLVPEDEPLSLDVRPLEEHDRRFAGLPPGFQYAVIAVPKIRGIKALRAFDAAGNFLGGTTGTPAPPDPAPLPPA